MDEFLWTLWNGVNLEKMKNVLNFGVIENPHGNVKLVLNRAFRFVLGESIRIDLFCLKKSAIRFGRCIHLINDHAPWHIAYSYCINLFRYHPYAHFWCKRAGQSVYTWQCTLSHTRTVVRECYKDDCESLWKSLKFDSSPRKNGSTDRPPNLYRWLRSGYLPQCKISCRFDHGFFLPICVKYNT